MIFSHQLILPTKDRNTQTFVQISALFFSLDKPTLVAESKSQSEDFVQLDLTDFT